MLTYRLVVTDITAFCVSLVINSSLDLQLSLPLLLYLLFNFMIFSSSSSRFSFLTRILTMLLLF